MTAGLFMQYTVIALAVVASVWVVAKKQFPAAVRKLRIAIALPLLREGKPGWVRAIGRRVSPVVASGSDAACGGCDNCGPTPSKH